MLERNGIPEKEQILSRFFDRSVLATPKAILECYEDIPCNPCVTSCPTGAIAIGPDINRQPVLDPGRCTGCGVCVVNCPGLAIMVAQLKDGRARFKIPHEFLPRPRRGEVWEAAGRDGRILGLADIEAVSLSPKTRTALVTVSVDGSLLHDFATVVRRHE
jgi:Fe-S-cluster-containing hydrogenase component 2